MKPKISKSYKAVKTLESVYSGGQAEWSKDEIFSLHGGCVSIVRQGEVRHVVREEEDPVICFTLAPNTDKETTCLVTAHKSSLVRIWNYNASDADNKGPSVVRTFRSIHTGPITLMRLHHVGQSTVLATGGTDASVKVWDITSQYYTHNFRTSHTVCSVISFHPHRLLLYAGWVTGAITAWDLTNSKLVSNMEGHFSAVTGLALTQDGLKAVSAGRDSVLIVWDLTSHTKLTTVPVFSPVEGALLLKGQFSVLIASEQFLSVWNLDGPAKQMKKLDVGSSVTSLRKGDEDNTAHITTSDHNLVTVKMKDGDLVISDTLVGDNDQVLSLCVLSDKYLAVACNSSAVRLYDRETWQCRLYPGHTDTVLCLAMGDHDMMVSGGKDNTVKVWRLTAAGELECLCSGAGHTQSVGGVAWCSGDNVVSVSADTTLKMWSVDTEAGSMTSVRTEIAHDKDINCVSVSPDAGLIVTGSQDKTAKLWRPSDLGLVTVLRGHTRGVWCAQFSPADKLVATGGGDAVVRLWTVSDSSSSCVKQLQGHEASVLTLSWQGGGQLVSGSSDGLLKVWWVARQECTVTMDMGECKVWCVQTEADLVMAGGEGGKVMVWRDDTEQQEIVSQEEQDKIVVQHQKLSNLIHEKNWAEAIKLALRLSQPLTALKIIRKLPGEDLVSAVDSLDNAGLDQLLGYIVQWNSNTRHSSPAQNMLHSILTSVNPDKLLKLPNIQTHVEGLLPYTEKHYNRLQSLNTKTKFIPYLLHAMKATNIPAS